MSSRSHELFARKIPKRGFGRKKIEEYQLPTQRERARRFLSGFDRICRISHQNLESYLNIWFNEYPEHFLQFVSVFIQKKKNYNLISLLIKK